MPHTNIEASGSNEEGGSTEGLLKKLFNDVSNKEQNPLVETKERRVKKIAPAIIQVLDSRKISTEAFFSTEDYDLTIIKNTVGYELKFKFKKTVQDMTTRGQYLLPATSEFHMYIDRPTSIIPSGSVRLPNEAQISPDDYERADHCLRIIQKMFKSPRV